MAVDDLSRSEALESLLNAQTIYKTLHSRSSARAHAREKLYVIQSFGFGGALVCTKNTIRRKEGDEVFYVLVACPPNLDPVGMRVSTAQVSVSYTHLTLPTIYSV